MSNTPQKSQGLYLPKVTRPDADNCAKALVDSLTTLQFFRDDAQIAELTISKWHGPEGSVSISIAEME